jgi:hypothetical protein
MSDEDVVVEISEYEEEIVEKPPKRYKKNIKIDKKSELDEAAVLFFSFQNFSKDILLILQSTTKSNLEMYPFGKMEELNKLKTEFMEILELYLPILQIGKQ